ncbi:zinc finger, CCHC-type containing protein [Tanacetum coccineum]
MDTSSASIASKLKSPTSSTSPSTNGYLNSPISPPSRVPPPPPIQESKPLDITLTLSPITPLDIKFNIPSPSMPPPPLIGHPIPWNLLEAHGARPCAVDHPAHAQIRPWLHEKDEALDKFRIDKTEVEWKQNDLIKTLRTDKGGEYYDLLFFQSVGIYHETTAPYTPQQNGVAERKNRALKEIVNDMLSYSGAVVRLPDPKIKTLGEKGIDCVFVGYDEHSKAYRFYVIESNDSVSINIIIESKDAIFERFSSIPRPKDIIPNSDESQRDGHSHDAPKSIDDEIGLIMENNTWVLSYLPPGCKWIFKRKMKVDGTIYKFKARLIVNSFGSYSQSSDPSNGCQNIIFYGDLEEEVYMKKSEGFVMPGNEHKAFKNKTCITSSTMESEFVALVAAGKEGEWLRNLIHEILIKA